MSTAIVRRPPAIRAAIATPIRAAIDAAESVIDEAPSFDQCVQELQRREDAFIRHRPGTVSLIGTDALEMEGRRVELEPLGLQRLCRHAGAPGAYVRKLPDSAAVPLLEYHLNDTPLRTKSIVTLDGTYVGHVDPHLLYLSVSQALATVQEAVDADLELAGVRLGHTGARVQLLAVNRSTREVTPGDVVRAGLEVSHSFVGEEATIVRGFVLRLVCRNGMTHRLCTAKKPARTRRLSRENPQAEELQLEQLRRLAGSEWAGLEARLDALQRTHDREIDVEQLLERWLSRARLSRMMRLARVAWQLRGTGANTMWEAVNALTWVATHGDPDGETEVPDQARRTLAALGGVLAFQDHHLCPACGHIAASEAA